MHYMQSLPTILGLVLSASYCNAQHKIINTEALLVAANDTIVYKYQPLKGRGFEIPFSVKYIASRPYKLTMLNNENPGWPGKHIYKSTHDSITIQSNQEQTFVIRVTNGKDTGAIYVNFVNTIPNYTAAYIKQHLGRASFEIPKAFELANIILALTDTGRADDNLILKGTKYYQEVINYFIKFKNHPVVAYADSQFAHRNKFGIYYDARNHTLGYDVVNNTIKPNKVYPERWGQNFWTGQTGLLEDFARISNFETFYNSHKTYYGSLIQLEKRYMPVKTMWQWLEKEFPDKYQSYKVIFSPLINGAHNTDRLSANGFTELILYVRSAENITAKNPQILEGKMSGFVFTEIDHNYVNPVSDKYKKEIEGIFSKRNVWTSNGGDAANYGGPYEVFNEYMTHALFCLYASLIYSRDVFKIINANREDLMINWRKFIRFKEFNDKLRELYAAKKSGQTVADLYPQILTWAKTIQ